MGGLTQVEEATSSEARRMESEYGKSAHLPFPPLEDATESTA